MWLLSQTTTTTTTTAITIITTATATTITTTTTATITTTTATATTTTTTTTATTIVNWFSENNWWLWVFKSKIFYFQESVCWVQNISCFFSFITQFNFHFGVSYSVNYGYCVIEYFVFWNDCSNNAVFSNLFWKVRQIRAVERERIKNLQPLQETIDLMSTAVSHNSGSPSLISGFVRNRTKSLSVRNRDPRSLPATIKHGIWHVQTRLDEYGRVIPNWQVF